jgi:tetratricopeptide (TPR) repeat protein
MRDRWLALDDQVSHASYTGALLAALWHTFWLDNQNGLDLLARILPVLAVADPAAANAAVSVAGQFAGTFDPDQGRDLAMLAAAAGAAPGDSGSPGSGRRHHELDIAVAALSRSSAGREGDDLAVGIPADREVCLLILRAGLKAGEDDRDAVELLETAAGRTASSLLRHAIGPQALALANRLVWAGPQGTAVPTAVGLAAAGLATGALAGSASAWDAYGVALRNVGRPDDAVVALDRSLELDPGRVATHAHRGVALAANGRHGEALAAYRRHWPGIRGTPPRWSAAPTR